MKKFIYILIIIFTIIPSTVFCEDYSHIQGEDFFNDTVDGLVGGEYNLSAQGVIEYIYNTLTEELTLSKNLVFSVFIIALMSGILNAVKQGDEGVNNTAFFVCYCLMTVAVVRIIKISVGYGTDVITQMTDFVTKLAPMFSILLVSGGYAASAASFYPVLSVSVWFTGVITQNCIVPLIYISSVVGIINNMSGRMRLDNFNKLIKSLSKWILTAVLTIFSAVNAIYGFCVPTLDGLGIKTAKFAVGSIVPVVGGFLSESIETVIGGAHLIKNAVGTAGIISLIVICAVPVIKVSAVMIILKISAALIEPVGDKRFSDMLVEAADAVTMVLAAILIVSLMFILSIAIIISSTNSML